MINQYLYSIDMNLLFRFALHFALVYIYGFNKTMKIY